MRDELAHKGIITFATHITLANGADRYVTCSRDGMVKIWNAKVRLCYADELRPGEEEMENVMEMHAVFVTRACLCKGDDDH